MDREGAIKDEKHRSEIQRILTDFKRRTGAGRDVLNPIALAYGAAVARKTLGSLPDKVEVAASGSIIKKW